MLERTKKFLYKLYTVSCITLISAPIIYNLFKNEGNMNNKTFACLINCMDGRVQHASEELRRIYRVDYVDVITEPGVNKILAENSNSFIIENIKKRVEISVHHHGSKVVGIVGHFDCAGNPTKKEEQIEHLRKAKKTVESFGFDAEIILLWVGPGWQKAELVN